MAHKIGDRVAWETIVGFRYEGEIVDIDSNVLIVRLDNGKEVPVEGWDWSEEEEDGRSYPTCKGTGKKYLKGGE